MRGAVKHIHWATVLLTGIAFSHAVIRADNTPLDFRSQVAPVLAQHCLSCHASDNRKGDISLSTFDDLKSNEHVIAGDPDSSYLLELVTSVDGEPPGMPKSGDPLSADEVALLRRWITEGAVWPADVVIRNSNRADSSWWSLQPLNQKLQSTDVTSEAASAGEHRSRRTIDDFIRAKLAERNLSLNPPADRRTLIRRATYDLTGLPPTPSDVESFVNDPDPLAYERLIDRLLESPHYGEHWGRHWLDVVRFGESIGYERNVIINNLWPFRDYVIRSINADKPFDQFIREHIAGDVFGADDPAVAIGSAFLVAGPYDDVGNQDPAQAAQIRANTLDEIIRAASEAFLGLTVGCARCHDHKFDPITQQDYYSLYATFSGVRHGSAELATPQDRSERAAILEPLTERRSKLEQKQKDLRSIILQRAKQNLAKHAAEWTRPPVDRTGTKDSFEPVTAKYVRLICESVDNNPRQATGFRIDEFEVWSSPQQQATTDSGPRQAINVALASNGGKATGKARRIEDFPGAYGPQHAIDGRTGARFISAGNDLTIELAEPVRIDRVVFSSARGEQTPEQRKFAFVAEYRIEVSVDGKTWREVASGRDRRLPDGTGHLDRRLLQLETTSEEHAELAQIRRLLAEVDQQISAVPPLPSVWIGRRVAEDARGPFHVFIGGSPQRRGDAVVPASLPVVSSCTSESPTEACGSYRLPADAAEADRRLALADWIVHDDNPLTPRVLANRVWHYHFGTGIVDTPSDFGFMGGRPTHPDLLDFLALTLKQNGWRLKKLHRQIMTSDTYRQSSDFSADAAEVDGHSRLLWRFPPRRLSAEEIRDTMLSVAGKLGRADFNSTATRPDELESLINWNDGLVPDPGPGFRLYRFLQDNVCTYVPLDQHGPETYRRAVYHQNARASVVDLMTDFDQPDCTFSAPRRVETTTPLQALTMLNHGFTLDMAGSLAERLKRDSGSDLDAQIRRAYQLCYARPPTDEEIAACHGLVNDHGLTALCRVLLNTSELIYVR